MKNFLWRMGVLILCVGTATAKDLPKYPVALIPKELLQGVHAVVRLEYVEFKIINRGKAVYKVHKAVTILNAAGKDHAYEVLGYDKLRKVSSLRAASYDASGNTIRKLKNSEVYDQSAYDGVSLFSDNRIKVADVSHGAYPYTVEFEYEIEFNSLLSYPGYMPLVQDFLSVQEARYQVIFPAPLKPRYRVSNWSELPKTQAAAGTESIIWEFSNLKPIKREPFAPAFARLVPRIEMAPNTFEYDGHAGDLETWDQFGLWIAGLNRGRDALPDALRQKIGEITRGLVTLEDKTKAIYQFMQSKTRYVSIQLGIGGFQPFDAATVERTGYGDCKALSNYMVAMLKEAGIQAHYVLIYAGAGAPSLLPHFPVNQFNHAVVCVPNGRDTLWLECTSQTNPFGYMGSFTGNRQALAITEKGAAIVRTPRYEEHDNRVVRAAVVQLNINGDAEALVHTAYHGLEFERDGLSFLGTNKDKQKEWIQKNTAIPNFDVRGFTIEFEKGKVPTAHTQLELGLRKLATVSGKRLFLTPNLMNRSDFIPEKNEERLHPIAIGAGRSSIDSIRYRMPEGVYPEHLPEPVRFTSYFGEYTASAHIDKGDVVYVRKVTLYNREAPAGQYGEFAEFFRNIHRADQQKIVFLSKT